MPADFERCVRNGGKVRTMSLKGNKYVHICYLGGKSYRGYVKTKGSKGSKGSSNPSGNKYSEALKGGKA